MQRGSPQGRTKRSSPAKPNSFSSSQETASATPRYQSPREIIPFALRRACQPCHEAKVRCEAESYIQAPCSRCKTRDLDCTFPERHRGKPRKPDVERRPVPPVRSASAAAIRTAPAVQHTPPSRALSLSRTRNDDNTTTPPLPLPPFIRKHVQLTTHSEGSSPVGGASEMPRGPFQMLYSNQHYASRSTPLPPPHPAEKAASAPASGASDDSTLSDPDEEDVRPKTDKGKQRESEAEPNSKDGSDAEADADADADGDVDEEMPPARDASRSAVRTVENTHERQRSTAWTRNRAEKPGAHNASASNATSETLTNSETHQGSGARGEAGARLDPRLASPRSGHAAQGDHQQYHSGAQSHQHLPQRHAPTPQHAMPMLQSQHAYAALSEAYRSSSVAKRTREDTSESGSSRPAKARSYGRSEANGAGDAVKQMRDASLVGRLSASTVPSSNEPLATMMQYTAASSSKGAASADDSSKAPHIVKHEIVTAEEANALLKFFFERLNPQCALLSTSEEARLALQTQASHHLLLATVCSTSALCILPNKYADIMSAVRIGVCSIAADAGQPCLQDIQALYLLTVFKQPAWVNPHRMIRLALICANELGLDQVVNISPARLSAADRARLVHQQRLYFLLVTVDTTLSIRLRVPRIAEISQDARAWVEKLGDLATDLDIHAVGAYAIQELIWTRVEEVRVWMGKMQSTQDASTPVVAALEQVTKLRLTLVQLEELGSRWIDGYRGQLRYNPSGRRSLELLLLGLKVNSVQAIFLIYSRPAMQSHSFDSDRQDSFVQASILSLTLLNHFVTHVHEYRYSTQSVGFAVISASLWLSENWAAVHLYSPVLSAVDFVRAVGMAAAAVADLQPSPYELFFELSAFLDRIHGQLPTTDSLQQQSVASQPSHVVPTATTNGPNAGTTLAGQSTVPAQASSNGAGAGHAANASYPSDALQRGDVMNTWMGASLGDDGSHALVTPQPIGSSVNGGNAHSQQSMMTVLAGLPSASFDGGRRGAISHVQLDRLKPAQQQDYHQTEMQLPPLLPPLHQQGQQHSSSSTHHQHAQQSPFQQFHQMHASPQLSAFSPRSFSFGSHRALPSPQTTLLPLQAGTSHHNALPPPSSLMSPHHSALHHGHHQYQHTHEPPTLQSRPHRSTSFGTSSFYEHTRYDTLHPSALRLQPHGKGQGDDAASPASRHQPDAMNLLRPLEHAGIRNDQPVLSPAKLAERRERQAEREAASKPPASETAADTPAADSAATTATPAPVTTSGEVTEGAGANQPQEKEKAPTAPAAATTTSAHDDDEAGRATAMRSDGVDYEAHQNAHGIPSMDSLLSMLSKNRQ